jgi:hypothetical protein
MNGSAKNPANAVPIFRLIKETPVLNNLAMNAVR